MTSSETAPSDAARVPPRSPRPAVTRALIGAGIVLLIGVAAVAGFSLADDPFAELPDDPDIAANLAGTLPAEGEPALEEPSGIAIRGNRVYVSDSAAGVIRIFDRYGRGKGSIAVPAADGVSSRPGAIALADDGRLAIVDGGLGQVVVVKARAAEEADILCTLGDADNGTAPIRPVAVAHADGEYYVVTSAETGVRIYDREGVWVRDVSLDTDSGIEYPGGLAVAGDTLWVADTKSGRVLGFNAQGEQVGEWPDTYTVPRGMALVGEGFAVADVLGQSAFVCDAEGGRTHILNSESVAELSLALPEAVAWDSAKSRLYVADSAGENVVVLNVRVE